MSQEPSITTETETSRTIIVRLSPATHKLLRVQGSRSRHIHSEMGRGPYPSRVGNSPIMIGVEKDHSDRVAAIWRYPRSSR